MGQEPDSDCSTEGEYVLRRGFTPEIARAWRLGLVTDPIPGHERVRGRLAIPYLTPTGVVSFNFRCIKDHDCKVHDHPKYLAESEGGRRLFGVWNLSFDSPVLAVTEGELDTIACTSLGGVPSVGIGGSNNWREWYANLLTGYDEVFVLTDGDKAGEALGQIVSNATDNARIIGMPDGHDVNSYLLSNGREAFRQRLGVDK